MSEMSEDLSGHYQVQKARITLHPEYANPVILTRHGWAKKGQKTHWYETTITPIPPQPIAAQQPTFFQKLLNWIQK
jgi:hypothetical protein